MKNGKRKKMPSLLALDIATRMKTAEGAYRGITVGTWGVCLACYTLGLVTRHHVHPKSEAKPPTWRGPLVINLCSACHEVLNRNLKTPQQATHRNIAECVDAIRELRSISL